MPSYTYKCKNCSHVFDTVQSISDEPLRECPKCQGEIFRQIGKNVGISFSGSGFYANDVKKTAASTPPKESGSAS